MYSGTFTALVTPFETSSAVEGGRIDWPAFEQLVAGQLQAGISGLVPCGTTGETPTLSNEERERVVRTTVELVAGKVPVIAGTGSNSTAHTIELTQRAKALGASAALVVAPYYNKPTQEGLFQHFKHVSERGGLPVMLYNVPGRTGCDIAADTVVRLQQLPGIVAIKEACGQTDRVAELRARCRKDFAILSGDDSLTLPMMAVGANGVVSVASNVAPQKMVDMVAAAARGDGATARELHLQLRQLFTALFVESNPGPAKAALQMLGRMSDAVRLPLVPVTEKTRATLRDALVTAALLS